MVLPSPSTFTPGSTYAIVFSTLAAFLIAVVAYVRLNKRFDITNRDDYFAARNSQGAFSIMMNFFASGIGGWTFYSVPEVATYAGSLGVAGYALSVIAPLVILDLVTPYMRKNLPHGVTLQDFVTLRFGHSMSVVLGVLSLFYMFIFLVAELTSVGGAVHLITGVDPLPTVLGVSLVTLTYTAIGGLPVSLMTDNVQGISILLLITTLCISIYVYSPISGQEIIASGSADVTGGGAISLVTLIFAVCTANMFHAGYWQRVWSAGSNRKQTIGIFGANFLQIIVMCMIGVLGMIAVAKYGDELFVPEYVAFASAFFLINELPFGLRVLFVILIVSMVASTADTLQSGFAALFSTHPRVTIRWAQVITVAVNVPAIVLATMQLSVLSLFILADLLCAATCVPIAMGMWTGTNPKVALGGIAVGLCTLILVFVISGAIISDPVTGLSEIYYAYDLRSPTLLAAFILSPTVAGVFTYVGSKLFPYQFPGYPLLKTGITFEA